MLAIRTCYKIIASATLFFFSLSGEAETNVKLSMQEREGLNWLHYQLFTEPHWRYHQNPRHAVTTGVLALLWIAALEQLLTHELYDPPGRRAARRVSLRKELIQASFIARSFLAVLWTLWWGVDSYHAHKQTMFEAYLDLLDKFPAKRASLPADILAELDAATILRERMPSEFRQNVHTYINRLQQTCIQYANGIIQNNVLDASNSTVKNVSS